jgi:hypothetical protein
MQAGHFVFYVDYRLLVLGSEKVDLKENKFFEAI